MDMFDLIDIQRIRHPKLCKFMYASKAKGMKSRIDFFLLAKNLTKSVKKTEIYPSIAPDHNAIYISLSGSCESPRGLGLWKFNNTLLKDEEYVLYQDLEKGGLRMTDVDLMFKALGLAWIPRLLNAGDKNWCSVPNYYFRKRGGLNFLLKCNYDTKYFPQLPAFYKNILKSFQELKILYSYDQASDLVLYNNKEILVDQKTVYLSKWLCNILFHCAILSFVI